MGEPEKLPVPEEEDRESGMARAKVAARGELTGEDTGLELTASAAARSRGEITDGSENLRADSARARISLLICSASSFCFFAYSEDLDLQSD